MARTREEAQRRRAEARRKRSERSAPADAEQRTGEAEQPSRPEDADGHETAKQAAKLAAAGAAVGAAVGAASALAGRDGGEKREDERPPPSRSRAEEHAQEPSENDDERPPEGRELPLEPEDELRPVPEADREDVEAGAEEDRPRPDGDRSHEEDEDGGDAESVPLDGAVRFVESARAQLRALRGVEAETVSAMRHVRDGWAVTLEVVEVERIPSSTDVLASYDVVVDEDGDLVRYERRGRYYRGRADEERAG